MKENLNGYPAHLLPDLRILKLYEYFSKSLNVTTKFVTVKSGSERFATIIQYNLEMILSSNDMIFGIGQFINSYILRYSKIVAVVPIIHKEEMNESMNILDSFFGFFGLITVIFLLFKYSRFATPGWSMLNIFKLMIGNSANVQLRNVISKIVYVLLLAVSVFFITDFVTDLTALKFVHKEELLAETVEEIFQKNLSVCTLENKDNLRLFSLFSAYKNRKILNIKNSCINRSLRENEVMISSQSFSEIRLFDDLLNDINNSTIVDMDLPILVNGIFFRPNSFFRQEFSESDIRFQEFGLDVKWARDLKVKRPMEKSVETDGDEVALPLSLMLVITTGWGVSIAVFLLELVWYYIGEKLIRKILKERGNENPRKVIKN